MNKKTGIIIFIIILVILGGFFVYSYNIDKNPININTQPSVSSSNIDVSTTKKPENSYTGTIFYSINENDNTYILSKKFSDEEKIIYTDEDEDQKIKSVKSMTNDGYILTKIGNLDNELNNSLYLINTENSEKTKIIDNFSSISEPIISPDGRKIAYTLFFNNEKNYGHNLYTMSINGLDKVKIDNYPDNIDHILWSSDSKYLIYSVNNELISTNLDNLEKKVIVKFDANNKIKSINENNNNLLVNINSSEKSKFQNINLKDNKISEINTNESLYNNAVWISSENDQIAVIDNNNSLYIYPSTKNAKISNANNIIKWLK